MMTLQVNALSKTYASHIVLDQASFSFSTGIHYLDAPNGSGKSTLLKLIAGIDTPDSGNVLFNNAHHPFASYGSYMPDKPIMYPFATGQVFLNLIRHAKKIKADDITLENMLNQLNIKKYCNTPFSSMSLGTQKKFFLISSLLGQFSCLLMDEPSNAIDKESMDVIIPWLKNIAKSHIIIIASHDKYLQEQLPGTIYNV